MCSPGNYIRQKNYRFVLSRTGDQIFSKFEIEHFQGLLIVEPVALKKKIQKRNLLWSFFVFAFFKLFSLNSLLLLPSFSFPLLLLHLQLLLPSPPPPPPQVPAPPPPPPPSDLPCVYFLPPLPPLHFLLTNFLLFSHFLVVLLLLLLLLSSYFPPSFLLLWLLTFPIFISSWKFCWKTPESLCNPSNLIILGQLSLFSCAASALTWGPW